MIVTIFLNHLSLVEQGTHKYVGGYMQSCLLFREGVGAT